MYIYCTCIVFFIWENCICTSKCRMHFTECPDLKPLTGRSRSMRRKAGDISPERQESIYDTEASKRAGSKKREFCAYMYQKCIYMYMYGVLYLQKVHMY